VTACTDYFASHISLKQRLKDLQVHYFVRVSVSVRFLLKDHTAVAIASSAIKKCFYKFVY
jgi:hypothetical protein